MFGAKLMRGGRMVKFKGRVASMSPVLGMAVSALAIGAAQAHAQTYSSDADGENTPSDVAITIDPGVTVGRVDGEDDFVFFVDGDYSSDFTNNGTLRRGENGEDSDAAALVVVQGDLSGTFANTGRMELNVSNNALTDGASGALVGVGLAIGDGARGFDTQVGQTGSFVASGAEITNDGVIDVELDAGGEAFAAGIAIEGDRFFMEVPIGGTPTPSFTTIESETATSGLTLTNNGTIAVSATAKGGAERSYTELNGEDYEGSFDDDAFAFGILLGDVVLNESSQDFRGSGSDTVQELTDQNYDYSRVALDGGSIVNEGTILVRAESGEDGGDASAEAYGIELGDLGATAESTVRNAGLIDIVVNAGVDATGEGISVGALGAFGLVENTGTINVAANADIDVSIEGIEVDDASTAGAVIRNTGTLNLVARTRNDVNVSGIEVDTDLAATLTNGVADPEADDANGEIIIRIYSEETDIDTVDATGIDVQGDVLAGGMIANHGLIDIYVSAQDPNDTLEINGIEADDIYGSLLNSGTINLELEAFDADDEDFTVAGIYSDAIKTTGVLSNSGKIDIDVVIYEGDDDDTDVNVDGIYVADEIAGQLTNSGLIDIFVNLDTRGEDSISDLRIDGIQYGGAIETTGSLVNSGTIALSVQVVDIDDDVDLYGIRGADVEGRLVNSGLIEIDGIISDAGDEIDVAGIYAGDVSGSMTNSGNIDIEMSFSGTSVSVIGIDINDVDGAFTNSGTIEIDVVVDGRDSLTANGIEAGDVSGTFVNSGMIQITAVATDSSVSATGIDMGTVEDGGIVRNSGQIMIFADGEDTAHINGIYASGIDEGGTMINTGSIVVQAATDGVEASADGPEAHAVYIAGGLNGEFRNSGYIAAYTGDLDNPETLGYENPSETIAIYVGSGTGTVALETQGVMIGNLEMYNDQLLVESQQGHNVLWYFDEIPDDVTLDDTDGAPLVHLTGGGDDYIMSAESDSNRAIALGQLVTTATAAAMDAIGGTSGTPAVAEVSRIADATSQDAALSGVEFWFDAGFDAMQYKNVLGGFSQDVDSSSANFGLVGQMQDGWTYGLSVGALGYKSDAVNGADQEAKGAQFGATIGTALGENGLVAFGLFAGSLQHDDQRLIQNNLTYNLTDPDGYETADASYNSTFITPALQLGYDTQVGESTTLTASFDYRHAYVAIDSYTETGTDTPATFGAQTLQIGEATLGLGLAHNTVAGGTLHASLDLVKRRMIGDDVDVSVLETSGNMQLGSDSFNMAELGFGYNVEIEDGLAIDLATSASFSEDGTQGYGINLSVSFSQ